MVIDIVCFVIFLFSVYQLSKDDFIFLRRNITLDQIFNSIFLALPPALISARLLYILLHPSRKFFNPLVFFALPYFPGLSLLGGIVGAWVFLSFFAIRQKIPQGRLLDVIGVSFLLSLSIGILLSGIIAFTPHKIVGLEQIGESMLGIAGSVFLISQFLKNAFPEGVVSYLSVAWYCVISLLSVGFMLLSHTHIVFVSFILTAVLFIVALLLSGIKLQIGKKLLGK